MSAHSNDKRCAGKMVKISVVVVAIIAIAIALNSHYALPDCSIYLSAEICRAQYSKLPSKKIFVGRPSSSGRWTSTVSKSCLTVWYAEIYKTAKSLSARTIDEADIVIPSIDTALECNWPTYKDTKANFVDAKGEFMPCLRELTADSIHTKLLQHLPAGKKMVLFSGVPRFHGRWKKELGVILSTHAAHFVSLQGGR